MTESEHPHGSPLHLPHLPPLPPQMQTVVREGSRWLRILLVSIAIAAVLFGCLVAIAVESGWWQRFVSTTVLEQVRKRFHAQVKIGTVSSNFIDRVDIYGVSVIDTSVTGGEFSVGKISVQIFLPDLLRKRIHFSGIKLDNIKIRYFRTRLGENAFVKMVQDLAGSSGSKPPVKTPSSWKLDPGQIVLTNADLGFVDSSLHMWAGLWVQSIKVDCIRLDSFNIQLQAGKGYFFSPWWSDTFATLKAVTTLNSKGLLVERVAITGEDLSVTAGGGVPFDVDNPWSTWVEAKCPMRTATILRTVQPCIPPFGQAWVRASLAGSFIDPDIQATVVATGVAWRDIAADSLICQARYVDNAYFDATVAVVHPGNTAHIAARVHLPRLLKSTVYGGYDGMGSAATPDLGRLLGQIGVPQIFSGASAAVKFSVNGPVQEPVPTQFLIDGKVVSRDSQAIVLHMNKSDTGWNLGLSANEYQVSGSGRHLSLAAMQGKVFARCTNPTAVCRLFGLDQQITGAVTMNTTLDGPMDRPGILSRLESQSLGWKGVLCDSVLVEAQFANMLPVVNSGIIRLSGRADSLLCVAGVRGAQAFVEGVLRFSGPVPALSIAGDCAVSAIVVPGFSADSLIVRAEYRADSVYIPRMVLRFDSTRIQGSGQVHLGETLGVSAVLLAQTRQPDGRMCAGSIDVNSSLHNDSFNLSLVSENAPLAMAARWLPPIIDKKGTVSLQASAHGSMHNPGVMVQGSVSRAGISGRSIASLGWQLSLADSVITGSARISVDSANAPALLSAQLPVSFGATPGLRPGSAHPASVSVVVQKFDCASLNGFVPQGVGVDGMLSADVSAIRRDSSWQLGGAVRVTEAVLGVPGQHIRIGALDAAAGISGTLNLPMVSFTVNSGACSLGDYALDRASCAGVIRRDRLVLDDIVAILGSAQVVGRGVYPFVSMDTLLTDQRLSAHLTIAQVPLRILQSLLPGMSLDSGIVNGMIDLQAGTSGPQGRGSIALAHGYGYIDALGMEIRDVNATVLLDNDTLTLHELRGFGNKGTLAANGRLWWSRGGVQGVTASITGRRLDIDLGPQGRFDIPVATLGLQVKPDGRFLLDGDVSVGGGNYRRDIGIKELAEIIEGMVYPQPTLGQKPSTSMSACDVNIGVETTREVRIDLPVARVDVQAALQIQGTLAATGLAGRISLASGTIFFLDRSLKVVSGEFNLYDPGKLNPSISLVARDDNVSSLADPGVVYQVELRVSGDLQNPIIALAAFTESGAPANLTTEDIVSLLTFGRTSAQLSSGGAATLGGRVGPVASAMLLGMVSRNFSSLLGVDGITLNGDIFSAGAVKNTQVAVDKTLFNNLKLTYQTSVGSLDSQRVKMSWNIPWNVPWINRRVFYLDGETDRSGQNSGANLLFRFSR